MTPRLPLTRLLSALLVALPWTADAAGDDWNLHLQSTYVRQAKPSMPAAYDGPHSLQGPYESSYSLTATVGIGARLGPATELYYNHEMAQGVPLSGLQGLGGFTNGEMARSSGAKPTFYRARLFVRQVLAAAGETDDVASGMNQLPAAYGRERWVLTAGNLSVLDIFDANAYSHDPRTQFMNWTLMTHGAYDYAADARGYTWGLAVERYTGAWTVRLGRFIQPQQPNLQALDSRIGSHYGDQLEIEHRHTAGDARAGAVRLLAFRNRAVMARYADALAAAGSAPPDLGAVRRDEHVKIGVGLNVEQSLGAGVGVFARAMWADGKTETDAFTEVDRSVSAGAALQGARWERPDDTVGVGWAGNGLSAGHRDVLARGGSTFFLGDGALHYRPEQIVEAYYLLVPVKGIGLTLNLQRIAHPGYNADRGPAHFVGVRLHAEI